MFPGVFRKRGDCRPGPPSQSMIAKRRCNAMDPANCPDTNSPRTSFTVKLGSWFEARAEGWGVAVMPTLFILLALLAAAHVVLT
jgi:hypothetical protein